MPTPLPPHIVVLIEILLQEIDHHQYHDLTLERQIDLYKAFGPRSDPLINAFRSWWAIYTAELVLPFFTQALPEEHCATNSLKLARQIALGEISRDSEAVKEQTDINYHWGGQEWGLDDEELDNLPDKAYRAGFAAMMALTEVWDVDDLMVKRFIDKQTPQFVGLVDDQGLISESWGEMEKTIGPIAFYFWTRYPDNVTTASETVKAATRNAEGFYDSDKIHQFWTWWLTEALERAWQSATNP